MTQVNYDTKEIDCIGRYQCITSVSITIYPDIIVATSDSDHITEYQMQRALAQEFPRHAFTFNDTGGKYTLRADANRWAGDGV